MNDEGHAERPVRDERLPVYGPVALRLLDVCDRISTGAAGDLAAVIAADPGLCGAALTAANSAGAAFTVDDAIRIMGVEAMAAVALTTVYGSPEDAPDAGYPRFWKHALTCRLLAEALADATGIATPAIAGVAGLMHDIGKIIDPSQLADADHALTAYRLLVAGKWPTLITDAIRLHHHPPPVSTPPDLAACVYLANRLAHLPRFDPHNEGSDNTAFVRDMTGLPDQTIRAICDRVERTAAEIEAHLPPYTGVLAGGPAAKAKIPSLLQAGAVRLGIASQTVARQNATLIATSQMFGQVAVASSLEAVLIRIAEGARQATGLGVVEYLFYSVDQGKLAGSAGIAGEDRHTLPCSALIDAGEWGKGSLIGHCAIGHDDPVATDACLGHFADLAGFITGSLCQTRRAQALAERSMALPTGNAAPVPPDDARLKELNVMAAQIAHIFNNLLAGISGRTQLLLKRPDDPEKVAAGLQSIEQSVLKGKHIIQHLQLSTQTDPIPLIETIDIQVLIHRVAGEQQPAFALSAIEISLDLSDEPLQVMGRADEVYLMLTQVVLNAIEAMSQGGQLTIKAYRGQDGVAVEVIDNGPGIPDQIRSRIFDPLFTTRGPQSAGLGLSLARSVMMRHGGTIAVAPAPDRGTCVVMRFPYPQMTESPPTSVKANGNSSSVTAEEHV